MDLSSSLKSEIFRPLVTLVVPGAIALGPYLIVARNYFDEVKTFWDDHPSAFVAVLAICILAAGTILENIGTAIERLWDRRLNKRTGNKHDKDWHDYLKLEVKDEVIGQRYLRIAVTWLKFELAMLPALFLFWLGFLWVNHLHEVWSAGYFFWFSVVVWCLGLYLGYESWRSAKALAAIRKDVIGAVNSRSTKPLTP